MHFPEIIPVKHLKAPPRTANVKVKVVACSSAFRPRSINYAIEMKEFSMLYSNLTIPARDIKLKLAAEPGDIAMVAVALEYEVGVEKFSLNDPRWLPAALIALGKLK